MASSAALTSSSSSSGQSSASTVLNGTVPLTPVVVAAALTTSSVNSNNNSTTPSAQPQQRPTTTPTMASGAAPQTRAASVSPTPQSPSQGAASSPVTSSPSPPTSSSPALKPQTTTQQTATATATTTQAQTPTQQTQRPPPPPLLHASNRAMSRSLSALPLTALPTKTTTTSSTASRVLPSSPSSTAAAINTTTAASTMAKPQSATSILPTRLRPSAVATAVAAATTRLPAAPATTTAAANTASTNSGAGRGSFASTQNPASSTPTVALSASSRLSMSTGALPLHHGNGLSVSATRTPVNVPPPPLATKPQQALRRPLQLTPSSPAPGGSMDTASPSTALHPSSVSSAAAAAAAAHLLRHGAVASNPTTKHLKPLPLTVGGANNNNSNHNHNNNTNNTLAPPVLTSIPTTTTTVPVATSSLPAVLPLHPQSAKPTSPSSASSLSSMPSSPDPPSSSGASATPSSPANTPTKAKPPTKKVKTAIQRKPVPASPKRQVVQSRGQPILPRPITKGRKITGEEIQLVQGLIERCLQLYMNQTEVITALHLQANIEPSFTNLIWLKLEEQNPEFFKAYHMKLRVKEQITAFNYIVSQQAQLLQKSGIGPSFGVPAGLSTAFLPTSTPTTLSQNSISTPTQLGYTASPVGTSSFSPLPQLASLQAFLQAAPSSFPMSLSNTVSPTPPSVTSLSSNIAPTANSVSPQPVSTTTQVQRTNGTSSLCSSVPTMNGTRNHIGTNGLGTNDKLNTSATTPAQQPKHALSRAESSPNLVGGSKMDMEKQNEDASGKASSVHQQNTQTLSLNGIGSTSSSTSSSSVQRQTTYQAMDLESKELSNANLFHMPNHHDDLPHQPHTSISAVTTSSSTSKDKVAHNTATTAATNTTTACTGSSGMEYDSPDCASLGTSPQGMAFLARGASEHISFPSSTPSTPPFNSDMNSSAIQLDSLHYSFADDLDCDFDIKKEVIYDPDDDDDEIDTDQFFNT
ncbi:Helicase with zinc finger protein [Balamuthia mandrillaris]